MVLIDMDRLRKELMAKGDIPIHEVFNTIWEQPIVNVSQQKVGKWIELGIVMEGRMYEHGECDMQDAWGCDYCGYQVYMPTKYCPNCGAKMEVEDENKTK